MRPKKDAGGNGSRKSRLNVKFNDNPEIHTFVA